MGTIDWASIDLEDDVVRIPGGAAKLLASEIDLMVEWQIGYPE